MDVINFSGGGPADRPGERRARRGGRQHRRGRRRAGDLGRERPRRVRPRLRRLARHRARRDLGRRASRTRTFRAGADRDRRLRAREPQAGAVRPRGRAAGAERLGPSDQTLVDVGTIAGTERPSTGTCGPQRPERSNPLPPGSLSGAIALVFRGNCTFDSKARRAQAAGAVGIVVVDNRAGETDPMPVTLTIPGGMVSDLDGANLRDYLDSVGGHAPIRVGRAPEEINTGRSGIVTYFSSGGPDAFTHALKPDVAAPGGQILSSTLPEFAGETFAVFDGTSMAAPHVTGAAALLTELHPGWTPQEVKSALVSTAGPAWANTARTQEAPVELEGGGLDQRRRARTTPPLFTDPVSLSFGDLDVNHGTQIGVAARHARPTPAAARGTWKVEVRAAGRDGRRDVDVPGTRHGAARRDRVPPVARRGARPTRDRRRHGLHRPHAAARSSGASRTLPRHAPGARARGRGRRCAQLQVGDTRRGASHASDYRFPSGPFAQAFSSLTTPTRRGRRGEALRLPRRATPLVNFGVSVLAADRRRDRPVRASARPTRTRCRATRRRRSTSTSSPSTTSRPSRPPAVDFPRQGATTSRSTRRRDVFTGQRLDGKYLLTRGSNDVTPPRAPAC